MESMFAARWLSLGGALLLLAACQSAAERQAAHIAQCEQYGFQRGTDAFAQCMLQLDEPARANSGVRFGFGVGIHS